MLPLQAPGHAASYSEAVGFKATREPATNINSFVAGIAVEHKPTFESLRSLIQTVAPQAAESLKWGTLAYDLNGSLFALSASKKVVNLYILTVGLLARHQDKVGDIPQSKCCLRFAPGAPLPLSALRAIMKAAVKNAM